jgi:hypothetical protein
MKYTISLVTLVVGATLSQSSAFAREVEGASPGDRGRTHDARGGSNRSEGGNKSGGGNQSGAGNRGGGGNRSEGGYRGDVAKSNTGDGKPSVGTNSNAAKQETTAEKAAKDLKKLSEGIGLMVERNEKAIGKLKEKGSITQAGQKMVEVHERETAKLLELAGKAAKENVKDATRNNPVREAIDKGKIAKSTADSVKAMENSKEGVVDAIDAEEKIGKHERDTDKLKTAKSEVDKLQKAYSDAAKAPPVKPLP